MKSHCIYWLGNHMVERICGFDGDFHAEPLLVTICFKLQAADARITLAHKTFSSCSLPTAALFLFKKRY